MAFKTTDLPQADKLDRVIMTVEAVSLGMVLDSSIANYIGFTDRQGRYYRHAAELLGFITNFNNNAQITEFGKDLMSSDESGRKYILQQAILNNALFKTILNEIQKSSSGLSKKQIEQFLFNITIDPSIATISRRLSTLLQWLVDKKIELINKVENKYFYNPITIVNDEDTEIEDVYSRENSSVGSIYPTDDYTTELDIREEHITVFGLIRRIQQGKVLMNPEFQRNFIWTNIQQSRFIESLILNIPLPPIYVSQDNTGNYIIIDGLQRSSTLQNFIDNKFELQGLEAIPSLNGLKYDKLPQELQIRIEDKNLLIYILRPTVPMVVVYDIFNRINTGGTQLTRQEIRNCIYIGNATELLKELSEMNEFKRAIDHGISPKRMKDREAVLRFLAFYLLDYRDDYKNDMDEFLGKAMKKINTLNDIEIHNLRNVFKNTMETTFELFGYINFRLPVNFSRGRINIAILESVCAFVSKNDSNFLLNKKNKIFANYQELINNELYIDSVKSSTGTSSKVKNRFELASQILGQ